MYISFHRDKVPVFLMPFSYLQFGCPMANYESFSRALSHSPDVNHCDIQVRPEGH